MDSCSPPLSPPHPPVDAWSDAIGYHFSKPSDDPTTLAAIEVVKLGWPRLISAMWLVENPGGLENLSRCQELPREAFVPPSAAVHMLTYGVGTGMDRVPRVVVLSYGWLAKEHPDPDGFHMSTLCRYLGSYLRGAVDAAIREFLEQPVEQQPDVFPVFTRLDLDVGVFWDFLSLPQPPRTDQEQVAFFEGLKAINLLYGAKDGTTVAMLKRIPIDVSLKAVTHNGTAYNDRGWCEFEQRCASIIKPSNFLCDLTDCPDAQETGEMLRRNPERPSLEGYKHLLGPCGMSSLADVIAKSGNLDDVHAICSSRGRKPPTNPECVAKLLAERQFTNHSDANMVLGIYKELFLKLSSQLETLDLTAACVSSSQGWSCDYITVTWDEEEMSVLAKALPAFTRCHTLCMVGHVIGSKAAAALASGLVNMPSLKKIDFGQDIELGGGRAKIEEDGKKALLEVLAVKPELEGLQDACELQPLKIHPSQDQTQCCCTIA